MYIIRTCTINEGCTCTIYIARHALQNTKHIYQILYKTQNTFIRYLHIYLSSLQHLLNLLNNFQSLLFLPTVEKYQRGEKFLFVKKHTQRCRIHIRGILATGFNKTTAAFQIFHCDKNDTSNSNQHFFASFHKVIGLILYFKCYEIYIVPAT